MKGGFPRINRERTPGGAGVFVGPEPVGVVDPINPAAFPVPGCEDERELDAEGEPRRGADRPDLDFEAFAMFEIRLFRIDYHSTHI